MATWMLFILGAIMVFGVILFFVLGWCLCKIAKKPAPMPPGVKRE